MATSNLSEVVTTDFQRDVARYWDTNTNDPVNLELGKVDDIYHHHYGLGDPDLSLLDAPDDVRDELMIREMHRSGDRPGRRPPRQPGPGRRSTTACSTGVVAVEVRASWPTPASAAASTA